jgi:hypothetical protein
MALASLVPIQGPKKSRFSGPTPSNAHRNDIAPLKIITYRAIKTTGTLIVIYMLPKIGCVSLGGNGGHRRAGPEATEDQHLSLTQLPHQFPASQVPPVFVL